VTTARAADRPPAALFPVAFDLDTRFGRSVCVALAPALVADARAAMALLHPEERALCQGMRGARLVEFAGGRIAARIARAGMPGADRPTLRGPGGMPLAAGVSLSISHTRRLAVALAHDGAATIGVDLEEDAEDDGDGLLAERIVSDIERSADRLGEPIAPVFRLSLKEATFKALYPRGGPVALRRIAVRRRGDGQPGFDVAAAGVSGIAVELRRIAGHVLSFARVG
jgi:4'-phosphopantetheinyl transferase EntD